MFQSLSRRVSGKTVLFVAGSLALAAVPASAQEDDDGIEEIRDMLAAARVSVETWRSFKEDFADDPKVIERGMNLRLP